MVNDARIICCERDRHWASWLRSGLQSRVTMVHCRTLDECHSQLASGDYSDPAFVLIEATEARAARLGHFLQSNRDRFLMARFMVAAKRSLQRFRAVWMMAGAVHVAFGYQQMQQGARIADRYFGTLEMPKVDYRQQVFQRIPW